MLKKSLAFLMTLALLFSVLAGVAQASADPSAEASAEPSGETKAEPSDFAQDLESRFTDPDRIYSSDVRWWLGSASATDDTLLEEVQLLYDRGFSGAELCMQDDGVAPAEDYAYGSAMWSHKWKLVMDAMLELGMGVYLTSGTHWATSNVPESYLDPDSQAASQSLFLGAIEIEEAEDDASDEASEEASDEASDEASEDASDETSASSELAFLFGGGAQYDTEILLAAGESIEQALPLPATVRDNCALAGVYAYEIDEDGSVFYGSDIDLTAVQGAVTQNAGSATDYTLKWTAPTDGELGAAGRYMIITLWSQGTYQTSTPAVEPCYAINYFDERGVEALRSFWEEYYLDDPKLNEKIRDGHVELFMDSIELTFGGGFTWWSENMRQEFIDRKGYDPMPYVFLVYNIESQHLTLGGPYRGELRGEYDLHGESDLRIKLINDWLDVLTQLYEENMLLPLKDWLNGIGITTRAQISYGKSLEITEPSAYVDNPEGENLQSYDNIDIYRLQTGGAKLRNRVLSTETGGFDRAYGTSFQIALKNVYNEYAAGFQRVIWHIWTAEYGYGNYEWPGYMAGFGGDMAFNRWGSREPSSKFYDEFNAHIGRIQQLLRTGEARTDIAFIHNNWNQGVRSNGESIPRSLNGMHWQYSHMGVYYRSTELQDHGYTYDYISPDLLSADGVYYDAENGTIELAGYKAVVIYQNWLDADGALKILEWAEQGLPVVILEHAAQKTPFNDGRDAELAETMAKLTALDNVRVAQINGEADDFDYFNETADGYDDDVYETLLALGVEPYAGFEEANHQLLTQSRADGDGNLYVYMYNYCPNDYHQYSLREEVQSEDHGLHCETEMTVEGTFVPYAIDPWTGEVTELGEYRHEDGRTVFPVALDYGNVALYAFEAVEIEKEHAIDSNADLIFAGGDGLTARATESGSYSVTLSSGETKTFETVVPAPYDITGWDLTVQAWSANPESGDLVREETIDGLTTVNRRTSTVVTEIPVELDTLTTWDNIPEVGREVSGVGLYEASFTWDASAATGAYIDFGDTLDQAMVVWINDVKVGGDVSRNPSKTPRSVGAEIGDGKGGTFIPEGEDEYTGGVSWMKPCADISAYLRDGENTIRIEYRTNLTNVMLAKGIISEQAYGEGSGFSAMGWYGIDVAYRSSGPQQAVIVPYVDTVIG